MKKNEPITKALGFVAAICFAVLWLFMFIGFSAMCWVCLHPPQDYVGASIGGMGAVAMLGIGALASLALFD